MYLAIELQSFGVYILATIYRNSESATNAGLKYFLLGGLSSCLILLGAGLIYSYTGITSFEGLYSLITVISDNEVLQGLQLGLILIFIGLLFKISAAPFHNWAPDVYNDVPTIVTTWLTVMPKIALIMLLVELVTNMSLNLESLTINSLNLPYNNIITNLFLISSLLSLLIGTILGLSQTKIKRLLAYSTISHVGFMLLCLGINTEESLESLLFYLIQYSITNLNTFLILLSFGYIINNIARSNGAKISGMANTSNSNPLGDLSLIKELKGQFYSNPLLALSLAVCLFSMAGIPPLMGFFAKQQVLYSSIHSGYYFLSFVAIIVSVISASYYLKLIKVMHFDLNSSQSINKQDGTNEEKDEANISNTINTSNSTEENILTNSHTFLISTFTLSILLFMLKPSILLNSTHLIALNIFIQ
jgi:NADH-ubiquinone oxidoreductase chain 2